MKKLFYGLAGLVFFVLIAVLVVPHFIDLNDYKAEISNRAKDFLGRDLTIEGDISFSLLPMPSVTVKKAKLANVPGAKDPYMAQLDELTLDVALKPLIEKKVVVKRILLKRPMIFLEKMADGKGNWEFEFLSKAKTAEDFEAELEKKEGQNFKLSFDDIEIIDAHISYGDGKTVHEIKGLTTKLDVKDLESGPYEASGLFKFMDQKIDFDVKIKEFGEEIPLKLELSAAESEIEAEGTLNLASRSFRGKVEVEGDVKTLKAFKKDLTIPEFMRPLLKEPFRLDSHVRASSKEVELQNFELKLEDEEVKGNAKIDLSPLKAKLQLVSLPGKTRLHTTLGQKGKMLSGNLRFESEQLKKLFNWLQIDVKNVPESLLRQTKLETDFFHDGQQVALKNLELSLHKSKIKGQLEGGLQKPHLKYDLLFLNVRSLLRAFDIKSAVDPGAVTLRGTTKGTLEALNTDTKVTASGLNLALKGTVKNVLKNMTYNMSLALSHKNTNRLLGMLGQKPSGMKLGALKLQGSASGHLKNTRLTGVKGALQIERGNVAFSGSGSYRGGTKPTVNADLTLSSLNLKTLNLAQDDSSHRGEPRLIHVSHRKKAPTASKPRWSRDPIDLSFLKSFDGDIKISTPEIRSDDISLKGVSTTAKIRGGILEIPSLSGRVFGGVFTGGARIAPEKGEYALTVRSNLKGAKLKRILKSDSEVKVISGVLNMTSNVNATGRSVHGFVSSLKGFMNFTARNGVVSGFNLRAVSDRLKGLKNLPAFMSLFATYMEKGQTKFSALDGNFNISQGIARIRKMDLLADGGAGHATGAIDLPNYRMDILGEFRLTDHPDFPPFRMRLRGPLDNPKKELDTSNLQKYMIQNIFTNIIENIIRIPGQQQTPEGATPQAPLENIIKEPAQAIEGILKGLF